MRSRNSAGLVTVPTATEEQSAFGWKKTCWSMGIVHVLLHSRKFLKTSLFPCAKLDLWNNFQLYWP